MFIALSGTCIQKFSNRHTPFFFTLCSSCGIEWDKSACRVPDDSFQAFLSPGMQEPLRLTNNYIIFYIRQLNKNIWGIDPRKDNHPGPFPQ